MGLFQFQNILEAISRGNQNVKSVGKQPRPLIGVYLEEWDVSIAVTEQ